MKLKISGCLWFLLSIALVVIDQVTKNYIIANYAIGEKVKVIESFFYITHHKNTGAAWGILQDSTMILAILSAVVAVILIIFFFHFEDKMFKISIAVVIGGAIGNFIDRAFLSGVTDFLDFYIFGYNFPIFNVADMCVVVGAILLSVYILFIYKEEKEINE